MHATSNRFMTAINSNLKVVFNKINLINGCLIMQPKNKRKAQEQHTERTWKSSKIVDKVWKITREEQWCLNWMKRANWDEAVIRSAD
ncbi:hypothetical protein QQG55_20550 [Brugia pahangi]